MCHMRECELISTGDSSVISSVGDGRGACVRTAATKPGSSLVGVCVRACVSASVRASACACACVCL